VKFIEIVYQHPGKNIVMYVIALILQFHSISLHFTKFHCNSYRNLCFSLIFMGLECYS